MGKKAKIIILLFTVFVLSSKALVFEDQKMAAKIKLGVDYAYNYEFDKAYEIYDTLVKVYPRHPARFLYRAMLIYWEEFPIVPESFAHKDFENNLTHAISISESWLEKDEDNHVAVFYSLIGRLMLMQFYADNGISNRVIPHITKTYRHAMKGIDNKEVLSEFYFSTGIYNYYREAYPEAHPIYKPLVFFFPKGNKVKGIDQLEFCWENAVFTSPEAMSFLAYIHLYFEHDYYSGINYTRELRERFPNNLHYISYHIQMLLLKGNYRKAMLEIDLMRNRANDDTYYILLAEVYSGIIQEKEFKNYKKAEKHHLRAINLSEEFGDFINTPLSYSYFSLSRIYANKELSDKAKDYRKKAKDIAPYPDINFD